MIFKDTLHVRFSAAFWALVKAVLALVPWVFGFIYTRKQWSKEYYTFSTGLLTLALKAAQLKIGLIVFPCCIAQGAKVSK